MARKESNSSGPMDRLKAELGTLVGALGDRAVESVRHQVEGAADRLTDYVEGGGGPGVMAAVTGARNLAEGKSPVRSMLGAGFAGVKEKVAGMFGGGGKGGGQRKLKLTNIVESIDVGVPVRVAYDQWTQYSDFPKFTKKVESVDQSKDEDEENKTNWKAQVFWSHRTWEATVIEQVPDERIVWRSKGQKGHVDGAVTFHELAPNLTRILLDLEYHPQGLFEHTGNLWRAQGRRARLELKNFRRHVMTESVLHADEIEGWRGAIHDSEVVESHEDAMEREEQESSEQSGARRSGSRQSGSRRSGNGRTSDAASRHGEDDEDAIAEHAEREDQAEDTGNGRAASKRSQARTSSRSRASTSAGSRAGTSSRNRRTSGTRSSGNRSQGDGRRQRASAAGQRGR